MRWGRGPDESQTAGADAGFEARAPYHARNPGVRRKNPDENPDEFAVRLDLKVLSELRKRVDMVKHIKSEKKHAPERGTKKAPTTTYYVHGRIFYTNDHTIRGRGHGCSDGKISCNMQDGPRLLDCGGAGRKGRARRRGAVRARFQAQR